MAGQAKLVETETEDAEGAKPRKVHVPVRLTPAQHDTLRRIAFERRVSLHALMLEGVAEVMQRHGK